MVRRCSRRQPETRAAVLAIPWAAAFVSCLSFATAAGAQAASYTIYGTSDLDVSACVAPSPTGTLTTTFWVIRAPTVTGPTTITLTDLPPGVTASVTPAILTYPGWVIGQQVSVRLSLSAGIAIPDAVVHLRASDATQAVSYELLLHGTCPRHNKDFMIRGYFQSEQVGVVFPIAGAKVEIWRDVPYWFDTSVGATIASGDGTFAADIATNNVDTYYAKLLLNDLTGVYLHDWWTPNIKDYESVNRASNSGPVVDLGGTLIVSPDGSAGTPKATIWQGGHRAFQEFLTTVGTTPPTGDYEIVIQNTANDIAWTARSTTNYEDGSVTFDAYSASSPIPESAPYYDPYLSQFINYSANFHEFGHALRHTVDGDQAHFLFDAARFVYARIHTWCGSASGYVENEGFGFNEGWAEYWSRDASGTIVAYCPGINRTDMTIEGAVAIDLNTLAASLNACDASHSSTGVSLQAERKAMFTALNRGQNIIHSEGEYRSNLLQQFPTCVFPAIGGLAAHQAALFAASLQHPRSAAQLIDRLAKRVSLQRDLSGNLRSELAVARREALTVPRCDTIPCTALLTSVLRPVLLRAQLAYSDLIAQTLSTRLDTVRAYPSPSPDAFAQRDQAERLAFRASVVKIVLAAFDEGAASLHRIAANDRTGTVARTSTDFARTMKRLRLNAPVNDEVFGMLKLPSTAADDRAISARNSSFVVQAGDARTRTSRHWAFAVAVSVALGVALAAFWQRRRSRSPF